MVGTAVYQLASDSSSQPKNFSALNPGGQKRLAPAAMEESSAPISPWIWNSGMMTRQRSEGSRPSVRPILRAEAVRLRMGQGHDLGPRGGAGGMQHQRHLLGAAEFAGAELAGATTGSPARSRR